MDEKEIKQEQDSLISEPDESGVRYYTSSASYSPGGQQMPNGMGRPPKKSLKKPLLIFGGILLAIILLGVACGQINTTDDAGSYGNISDNHISVLYIDGTIGADSVSSYDMSTYSHSWTMERLDEIIDNPANRGLILFVNTPGGGVYETDELYLKLKKYKETGRPLYSAMGSMAASGGYYLSAPADKIIANRNCWTGSIGVTIGTLFDVSDFLNKYGVKTVTITSGKNKAMGSSVDPLTKEQKAIFQSLVDESYQQFVGIVAEGRKMPVSKVKKLADGRIYTAKQALNNGLIDQIGTLEEAEADMQQNYKLKDCAIYDVKYSHSSLFDSLFSKLAKTGDKGDVAAMLEFINDQGKMPISYMTEIIH